MAVSLNLYVCLLNMVPDEFVMDYSWMVYDICFGCSRVYLQHDLFSRDFADC
jgi:hypothetical protein